MKAVGFPGSFMPGLRNEGGVGVVQDQGVMVRGDFVSLSNRLAMRRDIEFDGLIHLLAHSRRKLYFSANPPFPLPAESEEHKRGANLRCPCPLVNQGLGQPQMLTPKVEKYVPRQ